MSSGLYSLLILLLHTSVVLWKIDHSITCVVISFSGNENLTLLEANVVYCCIRGAGGATQPL